MAQYLPNPAEHVAALRQELAYEQARGEQRPDRIAQIEAAIAAVDGVKLPDPVPADVAGDPPADAPKGKK